ncbi:hypothetical protein OROMI_007277 [Orobanche minor]
MVHRPAPEIKVLRLIDKLYSLREGFREPDLGIDTIWKNANCPRLDMVLTRIRDPVKIKSKGAPPRQKQNCGLCGVPCHNRVTCPKNPANIERHEDVRPRTRAKTNTDTPSQSCVFDAGI